MKSRFPAIKIKPGERAGFGRKMRACASAAPRKPGDDNATLDGEKSDGAAPPAVLERVWKSSFGNPPRRRSRPRPRTFQGIPRTRTTTRTRRKLASLIFQTGSYASPPNNFGRWRLDKTKTPKTTVRRHDGLEVGRAAG